MNAPWRGDDLEALCVNPRRITLEVHRHAVARLLHEMRAKAVYVGGWSES